MIANYRLEKASRSRPERVAAISSRIVGLSSACFEAEVLMRPNLSFGGSKNRLTLHVSFVAIRPFYHKRYVKRDCLAAGGPCGCWEIERSYRRS